MKLEQSFDVQAPIRRVWEALVDVEHVASCLPGAEITEAGGDGTYQGMFTVKLGPTTAAYRGTLKMESLDEGAHTATMRADGQDRRGQGAAKATIVSRLEEVGSWTRVDVITDFTITGRLARFGRGGMIEDVSRRLFSEFASCLQAQLSQPPEAALAAEQLPDRAGAAAGPAEPDVAGAGDAAATLAKATGGPPSSAPPEPSPAAAETAGAAAATSVGGVAEPAADDEDAPADVFAPPPPPAGQAPRATPPPPRPPRHAPPPGPPPPGPAPPPAGGREPLDAGRLLGAVVRDRLRDAAPFALVAFALGWLAGRAARSHGATSPGSRVAETRRRAARRARAARLSRARGRR
jgi:carbon monoxide dehydrogenase subunit G